MTWPVTIRHGASTRLVFGAISVADPLEPGDQVYIAPRDEDRIAGIVFDASPSVAVPPGAYRLRTALIPDIVSINVPPDQNVAVSTRRLRIWSGFDGDGLILVLGETRQTFEAPLRVDTLLLGTAPISVEAWGRTLSDLPDAPETWIWNLGEAAVVPFDPLPVSVAGDPPVAVPGGELALHVTTGFPVGATVRLMQGDALIQERDVTLDRGAQKHNLSLPDTLASDMPLDVLLTMGPSEAPISGSVTGIPVHRFLTETVAALTASSGLPTEIELRWDAPDEHGVAGYRVYRGVSDYPVSGRKPITDTFFVDLALSAARTFNYRVCTVDVIGTDGPCADIAGATKR